MKKFAKGLIAAGVACTVLAGGAAVMADDLSRNINVVYNNIKLYIDGAEIVPKDAKGNPVEPFIYNGTTYLPVRAVGEALGKEVIWDGKTQSVYLGKKDQNQPDAYLSDMQWTDYREGDSGNNIEVFGHVNDRTVTDANGKTYTNGLAVYVNRTNGYRILENYNNSDIYQAYALNSQYRKLTGIIALPGKEAPSQADVEFYGDGKLLYKATGVTKTLPFTLDIDVEGVNQLEIYYYSQDNRGYIYLTDLGLYK